MLQALLTASEKESPYKNISDRAFGAIFLGVPHKGFNKLLHRLGWAVATLSRLFGSRTDLLNLAKGSPELDRLHHRFLSSYKSVDCICFYECVPEYKFGISIGPVFPPDSNIRFRARTRHPHRRLSMKIQPRSLETFGTSGWKRITVA